MGNNNTTNDTLLTDEGIRIVLNGDDKKYREFELDENFNNIKSIVITEEEWDMFFNNKGDE